MQCFTCYNASFQLYDFIICNCCHHFATVVFKKVCFISYFATIAPFLLSYDLSVISYVLSLWFSIYHMIVNFLSFSISTIVSAYSGLVNGPEFYDFVQVIYILFENFEVHIINNIIKFNLTLYFYGYCKKRLLYTFYDNKRKY